MDNLTYVVFCGWTRIAIGSLEVVLRAIKAGEAVGMPEGTLLIFENQTGRQVDFDLRGTVEDVIGRALPKPPRTGPGRPKLGVVAREISLLPRHWEWLETQPNGASAAIRRLVDDARRADGGESQTRMAIAATGRFMSAMAGNLPGFEEACRALYAGNRERLAQLIHEWPPNVRDYILQNSI